MRCRVGRVGIGMVRDGTGAISRCKTTLQYSENTAQIIDVLKIP